MFFHLFVKNFFSKGLYWVQISLGDILITYSMLLDCVKNNIIKGKTHEVKQLAAALCFSSQ